jgi:hypothetical protein
MLTKLLWQSGFAAPTARPGLWGARSRHSISPPMTRRLAAFPSWQKPPTITSETAGRAGTQTGQVVVMRQGGNRSTACCQQGVRTPSRLSGQLDVPDGGSFSTKSQQRGYYASLPGLPTRLCWPRRPTPGHVKMKMKELESWCPLGPAPPWRPRPSSTLSAQLPNLEDAKIVPCFSKPLPTTPSWCRFSILWSGWGKEGGREKANQTGQLVLA